MPLQPEKIDACRGYWKEIAGPRASEADKVWGNLGITRLVASIQTSPVGPFLIQYIEGSMELNALLSTDAASKSPFEEWVESRFKDFSGENWHSASSFPSYEVLYSVEQPASTATKPILYAIPVAQDKEASLRQFFADAQGPRAEEANEYQRRLGLTKFTAVTQSTDEGLFYIQYWEAPDNVGQEMSTIENMKTQPSNWVQQSYAEFAGEYAEVTPVFEIVYNR
jgi:hypothetical protein